MTNIRYEFRTFDDIPNVYEVIDNTITEVNPAVAVFCEEKLHTFCGLNSSKHYLSFKSWAKDVKKMFGVETVERTWEF